MNSTPPPAGSGWSRANRPTAGQPSCRTSFASSACSSSVPTANPFSPARRANGTASAASFTASHFSIAACLGLLSDTLVVADLGCGTGQIAAEICRRSSIGSSALITPRPCSKPPAAASPICTNVELRRGELTVHPIDDNFCDAALIVLALTYIADPAAAIRETSRILKPGGRSVIVDLLPHDRDDFRRQMNQHWPGFDLELIRRWLADVRFEPTACRSASAGIKCERTGAVSCQWGEKCVAQRETRNPKSECSKRHSNDATDSI